MRAYVIRRLLLIIPTLFIVTVIVFSIARFIPGNVIDVMVSEMAWGSGLGTELTAQSLRHALGLDLPIHVQYGQWLLNALQGDLGRSLWTNRPVTRELLNRLPISFELGFIGIIIGLVISIPLGIYSAVRQETVGDYFARTMAIIGLSLPNFWLGTMVMVFPSIWWNWSPQVRYIAFIDDPIGNLGQFVIPAIIIGTGMAASTMRMTRTMMLEVLRQGYIRTAWSKGLMERVVVQRHALKNALIPVVTLVGLQIPVLIGGAVIIEQIFALPGIGSLLIEAINMRDYPVISGINVFLATFILFINLIIDLTYAYLDPRIHYR